MDHLLSSDGAIIEFDFREVKKEKQVLGIRDQGVLDFQSLNGILQSKVYPKFYDLNPYTVLLRCANVPGSIPGTSVKHLGRNGL